jgi:hypothetical protein
MLKALEDIHYVQNRNFLATFVRARRVFLTKSRDFVHLLVRTH